MVLFLFLAMLFLTVLPNPMAMDGRTVPTGARSEALQGTHEAAESERGIASKIRARYATRNRLAQSVVSAAEGGAEVAL